MRKHRLYTSNNIIVVSFLPEINFTRKVIIYIDISLQKI